MGIFDHLLMFDESTHGQLFTAALLEVGGIRYPKSGNILILAGGSGSGKGHQLKNLIGLEGKVLDVDKLKSLVIESEYFRSTLKREHNLEITKESMKDPKFTKQLHDILKERGFKEKVYNSLKYIADLEEHKPNLIFDVTLSSFEQFKNICDIVKDLRYDLKKVHLVWVINTLEVALKQNSQRERVVPEDVVEMIHKEVANNLAEICRLGNKITNYLDGDIWISFNKVDVDVKGMPGNTGKGFYYTKANMFKIKSAGGPIKFPKVDGQELADKIFEYTKETKWKYFNFDEK